MSVASLETPAVVVDLDRVEARIDGDGRSDARRGVALRPHAKTHKSLEIAPPADRGRARSGLTVATIGEAEVFAAGGIDDLFIAYPVIARGPEGGAAAAAGRALPAVGRGRLGDRPRRRSRARPPAGAASAPGRSSRSTSGGARTGVRPEAARDAARRHAAARGLDGRRRRSPMAGTAMRGRAERAAAAGDEVERPGRGGRVACAARDRCRRLAPDRRRPRSSRRAAP